MFLAFDPALNPPNLAIMSCIQRGDGLEIDLLRQFRAWESGVDADGDPVLSTTARNAFGRVIKRAMTFWAGRGVKHAYFTVTPKMWNRIQNLFADSSFAMNVTVTRTRVAHGQIAIEVDFS